MLFNFLTLCLVGIMYLPVRQYDTLIKAGAPIIITFINIHVSCQSGYTVNMSKPHYIISLAMSLIEPQSVIMVV